MNDPFELAIIKFNLHAFNNQESSDRRPWPIKGQKFSVELEVQGEDVDHEFEATIPDAPEEVKEVMYDCSGTYVDDHLFDLKDIPKETGKYKLDITFWFDCSNDWESGQEECEYGFIVDKVEKLP